jgi:hypothetical protein
MQFLRSSRAAVAFISETKSTESRAAQQLLWLPGYRVHVVSASGMSGGFVVALDK